MTASICSGEGGAASAGVHRGVVDEDVLGHGWFSLLWVVGRGAAVGRAAGRTVRRRAACGRRRRPAGPWGLASVGGGDLVGERAVPAPAGYDDLGEAPAGSRRARRRCAASGRCACGEVPAVEHELEREDAGRERRRASRRRRGRARCRRGRRRARPRWPGRPSRRCGSPASPARGRPPSAPAIAPSCASEAKRCSASSWQVKSAHGVGLGRSSAVRLRSTGWMTASAASAATSGVEVLGRPGPLVLPGVAGVGEPLEPLEVVVPALGVHRRLLLGQALVHQGDQGAALGAARR